MASSAREQAPVNKVISRFPEDRERIARLAAESETFCSLCEDYALVIGTIDRLEDSGAQQERRIADYRALALDLEREIAAALAEGKA